MEKELSENHELQVQSFLSFGKMKRKQHIRELDYVFNEAKDIQLTEAVYTKDEVKEILDGLTMEAKDVLDKEIENATHTGALMLKLLMLQVLHWR